MVKVPSASRSCLLRGGRQVFGDHGAWTLGSGVGRPPILAAIIHISVRMERALRPPAAPGTTSGPSESLCPAETTLVAPVDGLPVGPVLPFDAGGAELLDHCGANAVDWHEKVAGAGGRMVSNNGSPGLFYYVHTARPMGVYVPLSVFWLLVINFVLI